MIGPFLVCTQDTTEGVSNLGLIIVVIRQTGSPRLGAPKRFFLGQVGCNHLFADGGRRCTRRVRNTVVWRGSGHLSVIPYVLWGVYCSAYKMAEA